MPRVYIVDDEPLIADTLRLILRRSGYDAFAFYDARSLLEAAKTIAPCVVISDVVMPGMSGVELAVELQSDYPECNVLLFSAQATTADLMVQFPSHVLPPRLLLKPMHPSALLLELEAFQ